MDYRFDAEEIYNDSDRRKIKIIENLREFSDSKEFLGTLEELESLL